MIISLLTNKSENSLESTNLYTRSSDLHALLQEVLHNSAPFNPKKTPPRRNKNAYALAGGSLAPANWCWTFFFFSRPFFGGMARICSQCSCHVQWYADVCCSFHSGMGCLWSTDLVWILILHIIPHKKFYQKSCSISLFNTFHAR